jgi:hypothetical protein
MAFSDPLSAILAYWTRVVKKRTNQSRGGKFVKWHSLVIRTKAIVAKHGKLVTADF